MKKVRKFVIFAVCIAIIAIAFTIKDRYENRIWYDFKKDIVNEYDIIRTIDRNNSGPHSYIWVYLKEDKIELESAEKIFGSILRKMNDKTFSEYMIKYHNKHASGEFVFMNIIFKYKDNQSNVMYDFEAVGDEKPYYSKWRVAKGENGEYMEKEYRLSDYK